MYRLPSGEKWLTAADKGICWDEGNFSSSFFFYPLTAQHYHLKLQFFETFELLRSRKQELNKNECQSIAQESPSDLEKLNVQGTVGWRLSLYRDQRAASQKSYHGWVHRNEFLNCSQTIPPAILPALRQGSFQKAGEIRRQLRWKQGGPELTLWSGSWQGLWTLEADGSMAYPRTR